MYGGVCAHVFIWVSTAYIHASVRVVIRKSKIVSHLRVYLLAPVFFFESLAPAFWLAKPAIEQQLFNCQEGSWYNFITGYLIISWVKHSRAVTKLKRWCNSELPFFLLLGPQSQAPVLVQTSFSMLYTVWHANSVLTWMWHVGSSFKTCTTVPSNFQTFKDAYLGLQTW